jgi:hypothetical protein
MRELETLSQALSNAGTLRPDGRLLHAYDVTDALYSEIHEALLRQPRNQMRAADTAGLYVLWAAERIRRHYDGSGLSWDFINAPLPHIFDGQRIESFIRRGLDYWIRPLRYGRSGNRLFMYSLLAEGGIPLAVLEGASQHARVLREMIEEIGIRGGVEVLGFDTASDIARQRMRYLPRILHNEDSVYLFVELAQAIFELRQAIPLGMPAAQIETWLNRERPDWQRELPMRVTPQVIDNIIRPSLAATRKQTRASAHPVNRELHADIDGTLHPVAVLAPHATLPIGSLPTTEAQVLRLLPRFPVRRPLAYRALRSTEAAVWELERIGASGPEVVPLGLFESLEFDVMADSQTLGRWHGSHALPDPSEAISCWLDQSTEGEPPRLRGVATGRSKAAAIWAVVPNDSEIATEGSLSVTKSQDIVGAKLVQLCGHGVLRCDMQHLRIVTGADSDGEPAGLFFFGKTLPIWRLASGEPVHLGPPQAFGQRGDHPMAFLPPSQLRFSQKAGSLYGAEFCEWVSNNEQIAVGRHVGLPVDVIIDMHERPNGTLDLSASGLPIGLLVDLRAGGNATHAQSAGKPIALSLPPRAPDTAFVTLTLTQISSGRRLELTAPWPSVLPQFICNGAILPARDLALAFDDLKSLTAIAPGNRTRMSVVLANGRSFDIPVSDTMPLIRHEALLRKMLLQGTSDNAVTVFLHNSSGQTGRITFRRYHSTLALQGDQLKLGLPLDLPRGSLWEQPQTTGTAALHLLQVETGEVMTLSIAVCEEAIDLRALSGVDSGLWLVQAHFNEHQQRPVAWLAAIADSPTSAPPARRADRIAAYRTDLSRRATKGGSDAQWRLMLRQMVVAMEGGDPAMLDQFHALADSPMALARMLLTLPEADLPSFFGLDSFWNVFWPAFPVSDMVKVARDIHESTANLLLIGGLAPSTSKQMSSSILIERLALLRLLRPEISGQIAIVLLETGLIVEVARDSRFEGLLLPQPQKSLDEAIQVIARSDPNLPRGIRALAPTVLTPPNSVFQQTVEIMICAVLSVAEQALGLRSHLGSEALLDAMLIESASPELFSRALQPAMLIAYSKSQSQT